MHATSISHLLILITASVSSLTTAAAVSPNSAALIIDKLQSGRQDDASPPLQSAQLLDNDNVGYYFNMTPDYNRQSTIKQRLDTISILGINNEQEQQEEATDDADGRKEEGEEEEQVVVEQRIPSQQQQHAAVAWKSTTFVFGGGYRTTSKEGPFLICQLITVLCMSCLLPSYHHAI